MDNGLYLNNQGVALDGVTFYGSLWYPRKLWSEIPKGIDVLITHEPPFLHNDIKLSGNNKGCQLLLEVVNRVQPKVHVFGHIHSGYGLSHNSETLFVNASICAEYTNPVNKPILIDYVDGVAVPIYRNAQSI